MSRAFVSDKEDWVYCAKAGERCVHAEEGKDCRNTDCRWFDHAVRTPQGAGAGGGLQVVTRRTVKQESTAVAGEQPGGKTTSGSTAAKQPAGGTSAETAGAKQPVRMTRRANIPPPKRWGGRSGNR